jgi:isoleucyl-tRNA synthetase
MKPVSADISFPALEQEMLEFWKTHSIFERSIEPCAPTALTEPSTGQGAAERPRYNFYDGPPFATGLPHYGHLLAGTIKDVVCRYFTMRGYYVPRRFGWDCHGVPVEFEIQKSLDLHGAKAIREFGIDRFNEECRKIVLRYTKEWERFVVRSGRWIDFENPYRTMDADFMESIWWALKSLWDRGLLYESFKCVAYSPAINTPLSNFEANQNYKEVQDPAVTVRAAVLKPDALAATLGIASTLPINFYVWTTTPWTLPSNMAIAVGAELEYCAIEIPGREVAIVAKERLAEYFPTLVEAAGAEKTNGGESNSARVVATVPGSTFVGTEYQPFFSYFESERASNAFRVYAAAFVTTDQGTGLVHLASFGEDDLAVFLENGISIVDPVDEDGVFEDVVSDFAGLHVKAADPKIISWLKDKGALVSHKTFLHSYPFCYRTDTPLIYKSISSWFVKVEAVKDLLIHGNSQIHWVPAHVRDGRFGNWLENARDWAISRNRFWGTPIPIWRCPSCGAQECLGSIAELKERSGVLLDDLHKHFVDPVTFPCRACDGTMQRIPQVLDCWFESGAMPYAQNHYPFENKDSFDELFPADFIAEGLDQTRGWFYTLLALSTTLFGRPAFRNVIVNGIVLAEDGRKMSKSLKNYPAPDKVMDEFGADALRLYLLSSPATRGEELRFSEAGVRDVVRQTLLPLWNAYNFFVTYALVDEWTPEQLPTTRSENILDRWMLSKVGSLIESVDTALAGYHLSSAAPPILEFVDQLTNWYIRLNRRRFWVGNKVGDTEDKLQAYATLHTALLTFVRVLAPLAPFISEALFQNLRTGVIDRDSVHLCPFPSLDEMKGLEIDVELEKAMELFEEVILLGRGLRNDGGVKIRQPLQSLTIVYPSEERLETLKLLNSYIADELNIKTIHYVSDEEQYVSLKAKLNTIRLGKVLGPKLGREGMQSLQKRVQELTTDEIRSFENGSTFEHLGIDFGIRDLVIERTPKPGVQGAASSGQITVVLDTALTQELRLEGLAREFVNRIQRMRKDFGFEVTDRVIVKYMTACPRLSMALTEHRDYVMEEVLAVEMVGARDESEFSLHGSSVHLPAAQEIDGKSVIISLTRMQG